MVLGLLTSQFHHERTYYTEIAKRARLYYNVVAQFTPFCIDAKTDLVTGLLYDTDTGSWVEQKFPIPSYIYERCHFKQDTAFQEANFIIHSLRKRSSSVFLNSEMINYDELLTILLPNKKLSPYIPIIEKGTIQMILKLLQKEKDIILKPVDMYADNKTYRVMYKDKSFHIETIYTQNRSSLIYKDKKEFLSWYKTFIHLSRYIIHPMPYPPEQLTYPIHIRCLMQKNKEKNWRVIGKFIQTSTFPFEFLLPVIKHSTLHPFSKINHFLSPIGVLLLRDALHDITTEVPKTIEQMHPALFELELSIIMDKKGAIWLMHADTRPSYMPFIQYDQTLAEEIFHGPLRFSRFIP
ncbi:YheC/YheD family protein [Bacillus gaemokensis]|uniref:Histidine kinase n=1 Tax=Bacillus gaemokensis TaxID=574375 RepID=A0A073KAI8_9BACI|nr:YheC/YheD family protein [Bacillus gaemokensis]KEK24309.1 histidine kinase [Bacillus gaemokensis]KYG38176.1 histidine kinase [Bacillus gaemokensis]